MKKIIFASLFCVVAASVHAEDSKSSVPQGDWIADTKTSCKVWNPDPAQDESIKWSGNCKDGKADGKGSLEWYKNRELQTTIIGTMKDGRCVQDCSVKTKDGDSYVGEMKDNLPHGKGVLIRADGSNYEGEFKDGERSGKGTLKFATGEVYTGESQHGLQQSREEWRSDTFENVAAFGQGAMAQFALASVWRSFQTMPDRREETAYLYIAQGNNAALLETFRP